MDRQPQERKREIIAALAVLIVVVAIVTAASVSAKKQDAANAASTVAVTKTAPAASATTTAPPATTDSAAPTPAPIPANTSGYQDGNYSATGFYDSPDGTEGITIDVTLKNGVITTTSAKGGAQDSDAEEYQSLFISGYRQLIVGKSIKSVHLSRVSGSSLTPQGFNNAISKIKQQAQSA